jgi:hypothetical protein
MATNGQWRLKGEYFENCNCDILCPCILPVPPGDPTEGHCDVALAFHIQEGDFNGVPLAGLNFVVAAYTPGNMGAGNWTTGFYVDERASEPQRQAIERILSGEVGGPMVRWVSLTTDFRGTKYCPITFESRGKTRSVSIPDVMDFSVEGITAGRRPEVMRLENTGHPVSSTLALARGTASTYSDHGMTWDNTGKNGHYAPFEWSGP